MSGLIEDDATAYAAKVYGESRESLLPEATRRTYASAARNLYKGSELETFVKAITDGDFSTAFEVSEELEPRGNQ